MSLAYDDFPQAQVAAPNARIDRALGRWSANFLNFGKMIAA
jgi:hypothetical protein